jgi:hypothetical protein
MVLAQGLGLPVSSPGVRAFNLSSLHRRLLPGFAFAALLSSAFGSHLAFADEENACGAMAHEAIAQAETALASGSKQNEHLALVCLLQAVKQLEISIPIRRDANSPNLSVPGHPGGIGVPYTAVAP